MDSSDERPNTDNRSFISHNDVSEGEENPIDTQESQMLQSLFFSSRINRLPSLIHRNDYSVFPKFEFNFESRHQMEDLFVGQSGVSNWTFKYNDSQMVYCPTNFNVEKYPELTARRTVVKNVVLREYRMKELYNGFRSIQGFQGKPFILTKGSYITPVLQPYIEYIVPETPPYSINLFGKEVNVVELFSPSRKHFSTVYSNIICEPYKSLNNFNMSMNPLLDFNNSVRNNPFYTNLIPHFIPIIQRNQLVGYQMVSCRPISMICMYIKKFLLPQTTDMDELD